MHTAVVWLGPGRPSLLPRVGWSHTYPTVTLLHGLALPRRAAEAAGAGGGAGDVGSAILLQLYEGPVGTGVGQAWSRTKTLPQAGQAWQRLSLPTSDSPCPLPAGFCVPQSPQGKNAGSQQKAYSMYSKAPSGYSQPCPHPRSLTSPCWGKFLESWDWMRPQTLSLEMSVHHPGSWGCWMHCH